MSEGAGDGEEEADAMWGVVGNACGAMALLHALGNAGVPLSKYLYRTARSGLMRVGVEDGTLKTLFAACRGKVCRVRGPLNAAF